MGTGTGDEAETQVEEEDYDEQDDFGSQDSLNSSRMMHTSIERLALWTRLVCSGNKQNHKRNRPVTRLCDHDEIGDASWKEQKHRAM